MLKPWRSSTGRLAVFAALATAFFGIWLAPDAHSGIQYVECSFSTTDHVLRVRVIDEGGVIRRDGARLDVLQPDGRGGIESLSCGDTPTVDNTDLIRFDIEHIGDTEGTLSLAGGPFAPGRGPEAGAPEIEIVTTIAGDPGDEARINGTRGDDFLRGGSISGESWLNLNPALEGKEADADMRFSSTGKSILTLAGHGGADVFTMNGGPGFDGALKFRAVDARLGPGADRYRGSSARAGVRSGPGDDKVATSRRGDFVFDKGGNDVIRTRDGRDFIAAGRGPDRISSGRGDDLIYVLSASRKRIRCGGGKDRVVASERVRTKSCERVKIRQGDD